MEENEFMEYIVSEVKQMLNFHNLHASEINSVEENCGNVWITDNNGQLYALVITKCES